MSKYLSEFQNIMGKSNDIKEALIGAITLYIQDNVDMPETALTQELKSYLDYLQEADIGLLAIGYDFKEPRPSDLTTMFNVAQLAEQAKLRAPSPLVSDCENIAAAMAHSPKAIYQQTSRLEGALVKQDVPQRHQAEVQLKVVDWLALLYQKFAVLILDAKSIKQLKRSVAATFNKKACQSQPQLNDFKKEVDSQIDYLNRKHFFGKFFKSKKLTDKYEYVFNFYQSNKENGVHTPQLRATLIHLFNQTVERAYGPCIAKRFDLMSNPEATHKQVFAALKAWAKEDWQSYSGSDLEVELKERLSEDEAEYAAWQELGALNPKVADVKTQPMYQLHCMKFAGDPNQNPRDLVQKLKSISSPVKPKAPAISQRASSQEVKPASLSLLCEEELDDDDSDHETMPSRQLFKH